MSAAGQSPSADAALCRQGFAAGLVQALARRDFQGAQLLIKDMEPSFLDEALFDQLVQHAHEITEERLPDVVILLAHYLHLYRHTVRTRPQVQLIALVIEMSFLFEHEHSGVFQ